MVIPPELLTYSTEALRNQVSICRECLDSFPRNHTPQHFVAELSPEDFYFENGVRVFTALYHQKRGYCCGSGCRHCPYRNEDSRLG